MVHKSHFLYFCHKQYSSSITNLMLISMQEVKNLLIQKIFNTEQNITEVKKVYHKQAGSTKPLT